MIYCVTQSGYLSHSNHYLKEKVGAINETKRHIDFCNEIASNETAKLNENLILAKEKAEAELAELNIGKLKLEKERDEKQEETRQEESKQQMLLGTIENQQKETANLKT